MKRLFKKGIASLAALVVMLSALTLSVSAASSTVAFSKSKLNVGETLTVTARFSTSSSDPMYGLEGYITYDPSVIEYVSGDNCNLLTKGKVKIVLYSEGKTNLTETIKFKTLKVGKTAIALEQLIYANNDLQEKSLKGSSATVNVVNPSTEASSNANLKNLVVSAGTLTPKFDPDVTSYSVTIKNDVTELWVSTSKADAKASVTVEGSKDMKVGANKRVVVVTAENGNTKRYTINITRLAADGEQTVTPPEENDEPLNDLIEVNVGDDTMYVVEDFAETELPKGFEVIEYAFNGKTVPALADGNYIILMLRLPDNSKQSFYVYGNEGVFTELISIVVGGQTYYVLPTDEVPEGYSAVNDFAIGDVAVPAFRNDAAGYEDFAVVYAKGPTGISSYYSYDIVEGTIQRLANVNIAETKPATTPSTSTKEEENKDLIEVLNKNFTSLNTNGKIVIITILAIIVLLIVAIIVLIVKIASSGKKEEDEDDYEQVVEEGEDVFGFEYIAVQNSPQVETVELPAEDPSEAEESEAQEPQKEEAEEPVPEAEEAEEENEE